MLLRKANQFVSFKFGDVPLLYILNFFGGATSPDFFLKAYKTSDAKGYFSYECMNGSIIHKSSTKQKFFLMKPSLASCAIKVLWKRVDFQKLIDGERHSMNFFFQIDTELTASNWTRKLALFDQCVGTRKTFLPSKTFCAGITTRMLFQCWELCKKWFISTTKWKLTC